jgi:hypothetical protein
VRSVRYIAKVATYGVFTTIISVGLLFAWVSNDRRGFLSSSRRTLWLEAAQATDGTWTISQIRHGDDADPPLQPPNTPDIVRIELLESSMGRTNPGWTEWRATHWMLSGIADSERGWIVAPEGIKLDAEKLDPAISRFIEDEIAPHSPASQIWPESPFIAIRVAPTTWRAWQRRVRIDRALPPIAVCLAVGGILAHLLMRCVLRVAHRQSEI